MQTMMGIANRIALVLSCQKQHEQEKQGWPGEGEGGGGIG